jgi:ribosomal protein S18 acetylase RimI-like enzyme
VLVGYQSTGAFDPARWFIVSHAGSEVGVLLLTEHPPARQWELVYMALVPHARRQGFGKKIVQFALERARAAGIETLLLAVDARNKPGCRLYEACGFRVWDRRAVYWKQYGADASRRDTFSTCQKE